MVALLVFCSTALTFNSVPPKVIETLTGLSSPPQMSGIKTLIFPIRVHPESVIKEFIGDQVRCKDIFSVHVEKGQTLESEEAQSEKCYNPHHEYVGSSLNFWFS
jgi:hypothetical protein